MKAKISPNLISFVPVRRGDWVIKVSVFKNKTVLVVARHFFDIDKVMVRMFAHHEEATVYLDYLATKDA